MPHRKADHTCYDFRLTRRSLLFAGLGTLGLSLSEILALRSLRAASAVRGFGRAKSCIVFFAWGGMSQLETWDPKPDAPIEVRGNYRPISTRVPGILLGEYMPGLAGQTHRLAIVRSVHHKETGHRNAAYWNLTGHAPHNPGNDAPLPPSRRDWPCLGSMVARFRKPAKGFPACVAVPYPIADRGLLNGQFGGFLGMHYDPLIVKPKGATPYGGVSPTTGEAHLRLPADVDNRRLTDRMELLNNVGRQIGSRDSAFDHYQQMAADLLLSPKVRSAFDLEREPPKVRDQYGSHMCGQSALLARRLTEAGVPIVTIYASAGDLNGSKGDNWDTHGKNFQRLKNALLPPLERASIALLNDLAACGRLDETLVVFLTEFGRTPKLNRNSGRDHFPNCYSVAFAGGGIVGGQVLGKSDRIASQPIEAPCGPADIHATIFHALGIPADAHIVDNLGRPLALCDGEPLPLFG
ncbi:MAG: hypothetical protein KatS3mg105_3871 [Gemmatales bacterium]|nr:MAG: hypothetical protein KatS3mg105_3871 [Gemmatales bacterium]